MQAAATLAQKRQPQNYKVVRKCLICKNPMLSDMNAQFCCRVVHQECRTEAKRKMKRSKRNYVAVLNKPIPILNMGKGFPKYRIAIMCDKCQQEFQREKDLRAHKAEAHAY